MAVAKRVVTVIEKATGRVFSNEERHRIVHGADEADLVNSGDNDHRLRQVREQRMRDLPDLGSAHGGVSQRPAQGGRNIPRTGDLPMTGDLVV